MEMGKERGLPELTFACVLEINGGDKNSASFACGSSVTEKKTMFELYWYVLEDVKHHKVRLAATQEAFMYS